MRVTTATASSTRASALGNGCKALALRAGAQYSLLSELGKFASVEQFYTEKGKTVEHPAYAASRENDMMQRTLSRTDVEATVCDQCKYGLYTKSRDGSWKHSL